MDKEVKNRINKIKGQLNGLERMIDEKSDCSEILNQIAAAKAALSSLGMIIFENEAACLNIKKKQRQELNSLIKRFLKTNK